MNTKKSQIINKVEITDLGVNSKGIARIDGMIVFVDKAIAGDIVDIEIYREKRNYAEAIMLQMVKPSPDRIPPVCEHFGLCGGCNLQNMNYDAQFRLKQKMVTSAFLHIGHLSGFEIRQIIPSEKNFYYRNKLEFSFSAFRWLTPDEINSGQVIENKNAAGFHIPGKFDKILDINKCHLQPDPSNEIRTELKHFAHERDIDFYNIRSNSGFLRSLIIRTTVTGEIMVEIIFGEDNQELIRETMNFLTGRFPEVNSFYYFINLKKNDSLYDQEAVLFKGENFITEKIKELYFRIGPKSFFQSNSYQVGRMCDIIHEFGNFSSSDNIYDLYSGIGTISLFLAGLVQKVIGVESVPESIKEAQENAEINKIHNTVFLEGEVEKILNEELVRQYGQPNGIIVDPPRVGLHKNVIDSMLALNSPAIIYVSCNPATQARDISLLGSKYQVEKIQPVDMFPQTLHVENIALLQLRKED